MDTNSNIHDCQKHLEALLQSCDDWLWSVDRNYCLVYSNEKFDRFTKTFRHRSFEKGECLLSEEFPQYVNNIWKGYYDRVFQNKEKFKIDYKPLLIKDPIYIEYFFSPVFNVNGDVLYALIIGRDISERKLSEKKLHQGKEFSENLIESMQDGFSLLDENGVHLRVNSALCKMTGFSKDELIGVGPPHPYWSDKGFSDIQKAFETTLKGKFDSFELLFKKKTGEDFHVIVSPSCITDINGNKYFYATVKDITDIKKIQIELKDISLQKDKFLSILAHDLRSPFNTFLGFIDLMLDELDNMTISQIQIMLDKMKKSATNLYELINNLLEWSCLHRGVTNHNPVSFNLLKATEEFIDLVNIPARNKNINISIDIPDGLTVFADRNMVATILRNLLSNAIKFSEHSSEIIIKAWNQGNDKVTIEVKDFGIGMSADIIENLFTLSKQALRPGTDKEPSTGLGLILCKEFIERHNEKIWVESEEGKGSSFYFTLPVN